MNITDIEDKIITKAMAVCPSGILLLSKWNLIGCLLAGWLKPRGSTCRRGDVGKASEEGTAGQGIRKPCHFI
jgi:hypothetical protein